MPPLSGDAGRCVCSGCRGKGEGDGGLDKRHPQSWGGGRAGGGCPLGVPGACIGGMRWPQWAMVRAGCPPAYPQLRTGSLGVVFEEADGFCWGLGVHEDSSTTRCLPCSHAWGGHSPKDSIKVKAPTGSQPVLWLRAEVGSRLYQDGVCVSSPEHGLAPNPFCKFQETEPPGLPLVLCHSFLLTTGRCYIPPGPAPGPLLFTSFVELLAALPLAPCSARKDFGGRIKEARVL